MRKRIDFLNWRDEFIKTSEGIMSSIDNDLILLNKPQNLPFYHAPFTTDVLTAIIMTKGEIKGQINLMKYNQIAPGLIIILPNQILEYEYISDDFEGQFVIMSKYFLESLNVESQFSAFLSVRNNPYIPLPVQELEAMQLYFDMLFKALSIKDHPYKSEMAKNLTRAFYYGIGYYFHKINDKRHFTKNEILVSQFLNLVESYYKQHHDVAFYANKLSLTPSYFSTIIKQISSKSANTWINEYLILQAKAMLKSTNMTIQQISYELNFPSQSFFGKYFKRLVGMSPNEYRGCK